MCGIAGALVTDPAFVSTDLTSVAHRMIAAIKHRGPDNLGVYVNAPVALAHSRLSIIDLSSSANQPMVSEDEAVCIVFNGEIYNFQEIRQELVRCGYVFKSSSDSEVVLHGYHCWGSGVFSRLRGMFAIAIWDARTGELVLGRDRVGKKPLFYASCNGVFLFGSEIKAILGYPGFLRRPNLEAIHHYLSLQYVPAPWSAFEGIRKVPQASYLVISKTGDVLIRSYWKPLVPEVAQHRSICELKDQLITILDESVRARMVSDVPLGAFLSGGVDSSAIVALMARHATGKIKTFCIGFEEADYDERRYAKMVAERYGTDHHEIVVRPNATEILPALTWHYNEPFADPSAIPTYYVSKIARQHVTVALNGDGGDEVFLGYGRYLQNKWIDWLPLWMRKLATWSASSIPVSAEEFRVPRVARRWLSYANEADSRRYAPLITYFSDIDKVLGYDEGLKSYLRTSTLDLLDRFFCEMPSYVAGAAWADIHTYLPDNLLVKVDIASMAHGLEARSPFLDSNLMEWAASISPAQKMLNSQGKGLLKAAMEPFLPKDILYRPKMGFGVPIEHWLKTELKELAYDILLSSSARDRGLMKPAYVKNMLDEHINGTRLHHPRLWALLMLELWFQMWIDPVEPCLEPPCIRM